MVPDHTSKDLVRKWLIGLALLLITTLPLLYLAITVPLSPGEQAWVSAALLGAAMLASRSAPMRPMIIFLSGFASMRYFYWRISSTVNLDNAGDAMVSLLLLGAEIYGLMILFLGYFQTVEVLKRKAPRLKNLPEVDVFIPTYNESVQIVRRTVIGAQAMEYPHKKIYVLDDGRRPEMEGMAWGLGCCYITRPDNKHAKAGNLNHALGLTTGELVAIFDADHVPVRSFLSQTIGFFEDSRVALVQAAQHFFNPDPYERNLNLIDKVAPEQHFFYRVIQPGNDFWNSAFFCGSCGVVRRSALEAIGGFKTSTVTEDAHTALELHARGYASVYQPLPLAAGLATETFAAHVKQRMRWARGMAQILRIDCPLFKRGLKLPQRLNYFTAMVHFFFGIPRVIMIVAPLTYLLFGAHPIKADALAVIAYILPHIGLSTIANSMISREFRHSFWAGVYEISIAPFTAGVTLLALLNPKLGKFNVTNKGTNLDRARFDFQTSWLVLLLLVLSVVGLMVALPVRLALLSNGRADPSELDSMLINSVWALANLITLVAAACVAYEQPQQRETPRIKRKCRCELIVDGEPVAGETHDLSEKGVRVVLARPICITSECRISIWGSNGVTFQAPVSLVRCDWSSRGQVEAAFEFIGLTAESHRKLVEVIFSGENSWIEQTYPTDRLLRSFWLLLTTFWRVTKPRIAKASRAPRLQGNWRAWYGEVEGRCLSISGLEALMDFPASVPAANGHGPFRLEIQPNKFLEVEAVVAKRSDGKSRKLAIDFVWRNPDELRDFFNRIYSHGRLAHPHTRWSAWRSRLRASRPKGDAVAS